MTGTIAAHTCRPGAVPQPRTFSRLCRRALALATKLEELSNSFPEFRSILEEPRETLSDQANRNLAEDRALVLSAIENGCWTLYDLREETQFTQAHLQPILAALIAARLIGTSRRKKNDSRGGQPEILYKTR